MFNDLFDSICPVNTFLHSFKKCRILNFHSCMLLVNSHYNNPSWIQFCQSWIQDFWSFQSWIQCFQSWIQDFQSFQSWIQYLLYKNKNADSAPLVKRNWKVRGTSWTVWCYHIRLKRPLLWHLIAGFQNLDSLSGFSD